MKPATLADSSLEAAPPHRFSRLTALWALYALTFRQHLHGKRWMVMAILFLLPAGLAGLIRIMHGGEAPPRMIEFMTAFMFIPQALLPLLALVYASGIINDELEEQTLTYLLVRPISRWAMYLAKLAATLTTTVLFSAIFTLFTYMVVYVGGEASFTEVATRCLKAMGIHGLAVTTYCCLFGLLSLYTRRALVVGVIFSVVFEVLVANLPFGIRLVTVIYYTRVIAYRSLSFLAKPPHMRSPVDISADVWRFDVRNDPQLLEHPSLQLAVIILLAHSLVFAAAAAFLCARREFHVKTPEGS